MTRSTVPPGWWWLVASCLLVYVPVFLVDVWDRFWDWVRAGDDNLTDYGDDPGGG